MHVCFRVSRKMPYTAYIVDCVRTPGGKKNGALREWKVNTNNSNATRTHKSIESPFLPAKQAPDLGAAVLDALVQRTGIDGGKVPHAPPVPSHYSSRQCHSSI